MMIKLFPAKDNPILLDSSSEDFKVICKKGPTCNLKIGAFPTAQFNFNLIPSADNLKKLQKYDYVKVYSNQQNFFFGEIDSTELCKNEDGEFELIIQAISSFFRLEKLILDEAVVIGGKSFRGLLKNIIEAGKINGKFLIDDDVDDSIHITTYNKLSAFLLLTHLIIQKNLAFRLEIDDTFWIGTRDTYIRWSNESTPIKVISFDNPNIKSIKLKKS